MSTGGGVGKVINNFLLPLLSMMSLIMFTLCVPCLSPSIDNWCGLSFIWWEIKHTKIKAVLAVSMDSSINGINTLWG